MEKAKGSGAQRQVGTLRAKVFPSCPPAENVGLPVHDDAAGVAEEVVGTPQLRDGSMLASLLAEARPRRTWAQDRHLQFLDGDAARRSAVLPGTAGDRSADTVRDFDG